MPNVTATLRKALNQLRSDRARLDRQIAAVETALTGLGDTLGRRTGATKKAVTKAARKAGKRARRAMSAAQKKAVSQRMKAYWARRRKETAK